MYPTFCHFRAGGAADDPYFVTVAEQFGLRGRRPGMALGERTGAIEVLVAADGRTALLSPDQVHLGLDEAAALGLMDAVEEAIEEALACDPPDKALALRLEATLSLLERCFGEDDFA